jgi:4-diphosphocytidyl-2-C-methyl-D-erythritol kinase
MLTVQAPAKINLTLEVLEKRNDGYHEIRSVIQTIDLCDNLSFETGSGIEIRCDSSDWRSHESLIPLSVSLLRESSGCSEGVIIRLSKKIPLLSGLAGDSSGAAATLIGLNKFWGLGYTLGELVKFAGKLGSDIPFFMSGGTALVQGRGESVSPLPSLPGRWVVLLMPEVKRAVGKTQKLYGRLNRCFFTDGEITDNLVIKLARSEEIEDSSFFNVFEKVAYDEFEGLGECRDDFLAAGAGSVHLAGSGPTLFAVFKDKYKAEDICSRLRERSYQACAVKTLAGIDFLKADMVR